MTLREFFLKLIPYVNNNGEILNYKIYCNQDTSVCKYLTASTKSELTVFFNERIDHNSIYGVVFNNKSINMRGDAKSLDDDINTVSNPTWWEFINDVTVVIERNDKINKFLV